MLLVQRMLGSMVGVYQLLVAVSLLVLSAEGQGIEFQFRLGGTHTVINEEQPVGTNIIDLDVIYTIDGFPRGENTGSYAFVPGYNEFYFNLISTTGHLSNALLLDRDAIDTITLFRVMIQFTSTTNLSNTIVLTISLSDINDNTPNFTQSLYSVDIPENVSPGSLFYHVFANDSDLIQKQLVIDEEDENFGGFQYTAVYGRVIYSIVNGNELNHFSIYSDNGSLFVNTPLDVDSINFYNLTLLALDGGGLNDTAILLITILDANDNSPIIHNPQSFSLTLTEDTPIGLTIIDYINVTDADSGDNAQIDLYIKSGDIINSFTINTTSGHLFISDSLDREAGNPLVLTVVAIDRGVPPLSDDITVTITLLDINDNAPNFTKTTYDFYVSENVLTSHLVGIVQATDSDSNENGTVIYQLISDTNTFHLENVTGELRTIAPLDRETIPKYQLIVVAFDTPTNSSLSFTSTATIIITIVDINDNLPVWDYTYVSVGVLDTEPVNYNLVTLQAHDSDIGTNGIVQYEFLGDYDEDFAIDPTSGNVTIMRSLDFSRKSFYSYTVRAYDNGVPSFDAQLPYLNITVHTPNIRSPRFPIKQYNVTLDETTSVGTIVLNVTASDGDPGLIGEIKYRIPEEFHFNPAGSFDVESVNGGVYINTTLDYDYR